MVQLKLGIPEGNLPKYLVSIQPLRLGAFVLYKRSYMSEKIEFHLPDIGKLLSQMDGQEETVKKAVKYAVNDIKSRAPGWIATETASVYNIKRSDINPSGVKKSDGGRAIASVFVSGETFEAISIVYKGRTLTPIHFSMSPKVPSRQRLKRKRAIPGSNIKFRNSVKFGGSKVGMVAIYRKYQISVEIMKGRREKVKGKYAWKSTPFLAPASKGSSKYIVFQRRSDERTDVDAFRTVSVPQMVGNVWVGYGINEKIREESAQRLQYHLNRLSPKR